MKGKTLMLVVRTDGDGGRRALGKPVLPPEVACRSDALQLHPIQQQVLEPSGLLKKQ